jgi:hypothetical protein
VNANVKLSAINFNNNSPRCIELDPVEVFASWSRVIAGAPIENRPRLLFMMAREASGWADAIRQQAIDDVFEVAADLGLVDLIGATNVKAAIAAAFDGGAA